jgi:hypothetical protein
LGLKGRKWQVDGEDCIMRSFSTCSLQQVDDQIKEDEMGGTCSTYSIDEKCIKILWENPKRGEHSQELDADEKII